MYAAFVTIVLIADIYHRAVVLPRLAAMDERRERERQEAEGHRAQEVMGEAVDEAATEQAMESEPEAPPLAAAPAAGTGTLDSAFAREESNREVGTELRLEVPATPSAERRSGGARAASVRIDSTFGSFDNDAAETVPIRNRALNRVLMALSNYDRYEERGTTAADPLHAAEGWGVDAETLEAGAGERPLVLHGRDGLLNRHQHHHANEGDVGADAYSGGPLGTDNQLCNSPYSAMVDQIEGLDEICAEDGSLGFGAHNWRGAWYDGLEELRVHRREVWDDIMHNEENSKLDKFLLICELPFTIMRKLSVPIPCEGYYCRALVALSLAVSPLWIGTYLLVQYEINLFWAGGFPYVPVLVLVFGLFGALIMRYAPGGDSNMALFVSGPIAFYGFIVAATWIDAIADQLVGLLGFLGVILRIPGSIMGLTVLAWGNSMGDLSANMTMARKGLANMAITACFAGPVFNILIGLGGGFMTLKGVTGEAVKEVKMTPSIEAGFFFLLCNCVLLLVSGVAINKGRVPSGYGYAALALYLVYVVASLVLQFSGFGGDG
uniref:Sodium/calcium exchanger membrane region domain-containing protein n=1 Tax=Odontella aurita TaxID=265563 RepID=A0A7S4N156_9STRA